MSGGFERIAVPDYWRLALMFDARGGDIPALEEGLKRVGDPIRAAAQAMPLRIGVADLHPDLVTGGRRVDGAVEATFAETQLTEVPAFVAGLRPLLEKLAEPSSLEIMIGPMFSMVPVRQGGTVLSLAFRRFPGTTSQKFREWWFNQHSKIAIPVLGEGLLAYDQVHVDQTASDEAAAAFGVSPVEYDAYDNLTWADRFAFLHSCSDAEGMATIARDEVGRIDDPSRRAALMYEVF
ncbi:EthD domain-containing protein [Novosphingobium sp. G106]|uniref:EthD domain-containing protein n=1 Tax=Novosphingobium sp. G106 TaxID=2849500 RepID=UPI001C2D93AC|nr:EthD domain-containing protein [Novosphingobium sp. G106]MBV1687891.1 EthD domain-containing protein [Novosphingobium sp. G106]